MHDFPAASMRGYWRTFRLCLYFAWGDTRARYKRSVLGPFWLVIGTAIGVMGLGFLWSELLSVPRAEFIPSLTIGLVSWQLISGCITEAPNLFVQNARLIRNMRVPHVIFVIQLVLRHLINFLHNLIIVMFVVAIYPQHLTWAAFLVIPGLALTLVALAGVVTIIAFVSTRYRDIGPLIQSFMPLLFFLTPVIYRPNQLSSISYLAWWNPLTYLIGLVRDPVLGELPEPGTVLISCSLLTVTIVFAVWVYHRNKDKLAFWI
jgi:ABC-type polysaccharide/polyol phosphate export permease